MKQKRVSSFVICLIMLLALATPAFAAQSQYITVDPIHVMVGGKDFLPTDVTGKDVPVFVYNGTTYAPLRALAEAYGLNVGYNAEKNLATVDGTPSGDFVGPKGVTQALTKRTTLQVSTINIEVNGSVFQPKDANGSAVSVFVYDGTTYAPLRALAEAYGLTVGYNHEKRLATVDFVATEGIDFTVLLEEVSAAREAEIKSPTGFTGYTDYLVNDPATKNLLTGEEVNALLHTKDQFVQSVSVEQAVSDIDLLFRALHVGYGAYYYFGQEAFDQAEAEVMDWLNGQTTVSVEELTDVLRRSLSFMVDCHSFVGYDIDKLEGVRYKYHSCTGQQYDKDANGYFKMVNGRRVSFVSFSDERVTMQPTLLSGGKIVYSPVLFCPTDQVSAATIRLTDADGKTYTEILDWTQTKEVPVAGTDPNYQFVMEAGLAYINIDCFDRAIMHLYEELPRTGSMVKNCKAVIFDLRANGGGTGNPTDEWVKNFTGTLPEVREALAHRYSVLNSSNCQSEYDVEHIRSGKWLPNDIPVIVLVDDACGSSGEDSLRMLKTMDNVLVVGTNSTGAILGGNCVDINLPHTNIDASIGTMLMCPYTTENRDCIGHTPDVWCESDLALDAALELLVSSGVVDSQSVLSFRQALSEVINEDEITLGFGQLTVRGKQQVGAGDGTHTVTVYLNDEPTSDFTVTVADPSVCTVRKTADGKFQVVVTGSGSTAITVRCGKTEEVFYLASRL